MEVPRAACLACLALLLVSSSAEPEPSPGPSPEPSPEPSPGPSPEPSPEPRSEPSPRSSPEPRSEPQQVLVLSSDKLPSIQPADTVAAESKISDVAALQNYQIIQSLQKMQSLQSLRTLQNLQKLQSAGDRPKRSGNVLQLLGGASSGSSGGVGAGAAPVVNGGTSSGGLLGGKGILGSLLASSSSNSAASTGLAVNGKGPTYGNYIGTGAGLPMVEDQRSFDLSSFRQSLMGVLMTAVRAITGGVVALKGQLIRVKGQLLTAKGNIISASGQALSQFGRNIASNALNPKPVETAPPPRPVYGPPGFMMLPIPPRPVYGPPMYSPPGPISFGNMPGFGQLSFPRPMYGVPGMHSMPAFNMYSDVISNGLPRYQPPVPSPPPSTPKLPPAFSSNSLSGALSSYGPPPPSSPFSGGPTAPQFSGPPSGPASGGPALSPSFTDLSYPGAPPPPPPASADSFFSGGQPLSPGPSQSQTPESQRPPSVPSQSEVAQELNGLSYAEPETTYGGQGAASEPESYFKRNANLGRNSAAPSTNPLQGVHAGLLLIKPAHRGHPEAVSSNSREDSSLNDQTQSQSKKEVGTLSGLAQKVSKPSQFISSDIDVRTGEGDISENADEANKNKRTFSLLFGSQKPRPLRPHPVTRALPPEVIAAASAQLAAHLQLTGHLPPRTATAVSGPHGKFIMYHK